MEAPDLLHYWGKARSQSAGGPDYHPLVYHALDVAAVGYQLILRDPQLREDLAKSAYIPVDRVPAFVAGQLAVHDIGKFSMDFQGLNEPLCIRLHGTPGGQYRYRHDALGARLLDELCAASGYKRRYIRGWQNIVCGHHGVPPKPLDRSIRHLFRDVDISYAKHYLSIVGLLFDTDYSHADTRQASNCLRDNSWWLAGFSTLCDWLGSNQAFFPYIAPEYSAGEYWSRVALENATQILEATNLSPPHRASAQPFGSIFPAIAVPTPLQKAIDDLPIVKSPQLFFIEDVTGAGKTEAAFYLIHRLLSEGAADGFFIGLPTMATANAMYTRTAQIYSSLFASATSLVLAHGAAKLSAEFRTSILPLEQSREHYASAEWGASAECNWWLSDNRKAALLAHAGIGTIDQALMGALMTRFQSLRLFGLRRKVLVVDEVHACDDYMNRTLCELLRIHAMQGGSAILLSATLADSQKRELAEAFGAQLDSPWPEYPLLTVVTPKANLQLSVETMPRLKRTVDFELVYSEDEVFERIDQARAAGKCVCWIRNTVADAVDAAARFDGADLFHARFTLGDRLATEKNIINAFGKGSGPRERCGRVVLATQVIEQSLDVDFDLVVSDLAPIDLVIQRAGRCMRHPRDASGCVSSHEGRGTPRVLVLSPRVGAEPKEDWFSQVFPRGTFVYPETDLLWLSASLLKERRQMRVPEDVRNFVDAVYDGSPPPTLLSAAQRGRQRRELDNDLAVANTIKPAAGYVATPQSWWSDDKVPTRLGEPTTTLVLYRAGVPWNGDVAHSQVSVRRALVREPAPGFEKAVDNPYQVGLNLHLVEEQWRAEVIDGRGKNRRLTYCDVIGLSVGSAV